MSLFRKFSQRPPDLLKEATARKERGDLRGAIGCLRSAYARIGKDDGYTVSTFLRLPMYLQLAGKPRQAWREFDLLLRHGYAGQPRAKGLRAMDVSEVYDKMRLFLQREGRARDAVAYGVMSTASWCQGMVLQRRKSELGDASDEEWIAEWLSPLLRKAGRMDALPELVALVASYLAKPRDIDFAELHEEVDRATR
ncbi:MAG: hypothetical protein JXA57_13810 [Armatimonadetes bacterium]|nr:hypothetical protein [Armatimonadota bacterium]